MGFLGWKHPAEWSGVFVVRLRPAHLSFSPAAKNPDTSIEGRAGFSEVPSRVKHVFHGPRIRERERGSSLAKCQALFAGQQGSARLSSACVIVTHFPPEGSLGSLPSGLSFLVWTGGERSARLLSIAQKHVQ